MEVAGLILAVVSLLISIFTFWWTSIRKESDFYLVRVDIPLTSMMPEFALVNSSSYDALITSIRCGLQGASKNSVLYLPQEIQIQPQNSVLLEKGKAIYCKITLPDPLPKEVVQSGTLEDKKFNPPMYLMDLIVDVSWVRTDGESFSKSVHLYSYGLTEHGEIRLRSPRSEKVLLSSEPVKSS